MRYLRDSTGIPNRVRNIDVFNNFYFLVKAIINKGVIINMEKQVREVQPRQKFTEAVVRKLIRKNRRYYHVDSEVIGLRVYVDMAGQKTFHLSRYVKGLGNIRTKLGTFPEMTLAGARKLAKKYKSLSTLGKDPKVEADKEKSIHKTLGETVEEYIKKKMTLNTKNIKDQVKFMRGFYLGETTDADLTKYWNANERILSIKDKTIPELDEDFLVDAHKSLTDNRGRYVANRYIAKLRMLINWEIRREKYAGKNPIVVIKSDNLYWNEEEKDHLDFYSSKSMAKIIAAALKLSKDWKKRVVCYAILAALYCGGRCKSEVFNLTWSQIDFEKKLIKYSKTKTGRGVRPITDTMVAHLRQIQKWRSEKGTASPFYFGPKDARHDYIFPNWMYGKNKMTKRGVKKCKLLHVFEVKKTWDEIIKLAGVERRDLKSLRHTFATFCVTKNVPLRMIQKYLMHKTIKTTEVYAAASDELIITENEKVTEAFEEIINAA